MNRCRFSDRTPSSSSAYILVGPTAVGKSLVAEYIAQRYDLGILSADSMLVYTGMDLGTAKPSPDVRERIPYWGLDLVDPAQPFNVGVYRQRAWQALIEAERRAVSMLIVGGTGLYVKSLMAGLDVAVGVSETLRHQLQQLYESRGVAGLQHALRKESPEHLDALADPNNPRRLMRALELARQQVDPPQGWEERADGVIVGLRMERQAHRKRIHDRVLKMFQSGLLTEAEDLRKAFPKISNTAEKAIGYAEAWSCLDGDLTKEEAIRRTALRTCQYAKRQMTWFRNKLDVAWVDVKPDFDVGTTADQVIDLWEKNGSVSLSMPGGDKLKKKHSIYCMRDLPATLQPRELMAKRGPEALTDGQLLALLLRTGKPGTNVLDLAEQLIAKHGTLNELADASQIELEEFSAIGPTKAQILQAAFELARRIECELPNQPVVRTPEQAAKVLRGHARGATQEIFWVLLLDTKFRLKRAPYEVSKGILDASLVHPREIFREAIRTSSAAILLAHNHPSGDPNPSPEDIRITKNLVEVGRIIDIDVLDHVILGKLSQENEVEFLSLREAGLVEF